jgi:hypothetical protein
MNSTWFQAVISAIVALFCMYLIGVGNRTDSAWTMLSSIIAYWMPSPSSSLVAKQTEEKKSKPEPEA